MYCNTPHPSHNDILSRHTPQYFKGLAAARTTGTIHVRVRYVFIQQRLTDDLLLESIAANHQVLNDCFGGWRRELDDLPNSLTQPWKDLMTTADIRFEPGNIRDLVVEYISTEETIDNVNPLPDCERIAGRTDNMINVYFAILVGETSTLGIAEVASNVIFVDARTVGSTSLPGTMPRHNFGKTLVHEMGHALGLYHTFSDSICDNQKRYPDIPEQIRPNTEAYIEKVSGQWVQRNDNRERDLANESGILSCAKTPGQLDSALSEQAVNFMDYSEDIYSRMFTQSQVDVMRNFLLNGSGRIYVEAVMIVDPPYSPPDPSQDPNVDSTKNTLSAGAIAGIVIGVLVFVAIVMAVLIMLYRRHRSADVKVVPEIRK